MIGNKFIDRELETKLINRSLDNLSQKQTGENFILVVTGIPGIGKTELLTWCKEKAKQEKKANHRILIEKEHYDKSTSSGREELIYILDQIAKKLSFKNNEAWKSTRQEFIDNTDEPDKYILREFARQLNTVLKEETMLLLIDDAHLLGKESFQFLDRILTKIEHTNHLFVILTSCNDKFRWDSYDLRRRTQSLHLRTFDKNDIKECFPGCVNEIYKLTWGYPLAVDWARHKITDCRPAELTGLKAKDFENVIVEKIIKQDEIQTQLEQISPLRRFDGYLLSEFFKEDDEYKTHTILDFNALISNLSATTYMIKWEPARVGYALADPVRYLFAQSLRQQKKDRFKKSHKIMEKWYGDKIDALWKRPDQDLFSRPETVIYLIEYMFHFINSSPEKDYQPLKNKLERYFGYFYPRELNHFWENYKLDHELHELLGDQEEKIIREFIQSKTR